MKILYKKRHLPTSLPVSRQPSIPTTRARIWGLQADPQALAEAHAHIKRPARLQPAQQPEDLPYGQSGIRRLTPSSIHNSLRSIKQIAVLRLKSSSFSKIFSHRSRKTQACNAPLIPTGEEWSPSLLQCGVDRQHSVAREIPASLAFKAAPRKCKQASIPLGLHLN